MFDRQYSGTPCCCKSRISCTGVGLFDERVTDRIEQRHQLRAGQPEAGFEPVNQFRFGEAASIKCLPIRMTKQRGFEFALQRPIRLEARDDAIRVPIEDHTAQIKNDISEHAEF